VKEQPEMDFKGAEWWQHYSSSRTEECCHCNCVIPRNVPCLRSEGESYLHQGCWEAHVGFQIALSKDD
jgi:hypothetical protein